MGATCLNLACLLDQQARLTPARDAVVYNTTRLSYSRVNALASQLAHGLRSLGLGPGDHIALTCPNVPHFPVACYGILKMGGVVVPLSVLLKPREIAAHLRDAHVKALLVFEGTPDLPTARMARAACDEVARCAHLVVITTEPDGACPVDRGLVFDDLLRSQPAVFETHPAAPDDTAAILYTSGTTGHPKGAELTHVNMVTNALVSRDMIAPLLDSPLAGTTRQLVTLPLSYSTGLTCQLNAGVAGGHTLVLQSRFEPAAVLAAMSEHGISCWVGVPTMYWALLHHVRTAGADVTAARSALRVCCSGGAPMPSDVLADFERMFGVRILEGYGLSETSPVACFNQVFRPSRPGTVGRPVLGCEVRVVDEGGRPLPTGERGEIVIRGQNVMKGYYNRPAETAAVLRDGWLHTGDIGVFDVDGCLTVVDRRTDVVLRGGMQVYPREIEDVLLSHPAVAVAAVVGMPDDRLGEEVKAFVVLRPDAAVTVADLVAWSRDQLAAYKYPRVVEIRETLPVGPTGAVVKRGLAGRR